LTEAEVNPQRLNAALRLADSDALEVDDDGQVTPASLQAVIAAVKEESPEWFGSQRRSVGGNGSNPPTEPPNANPGYDQMSPEQFEDMRRRVLLGERIPV
jgi:hypothetical protein